MIRTEEEYNSAIEKAHSLIDIDPDPGTKEQKELETLVRMIEKYEDGKYLTFEQD